MNYSEAAFELVLEAVRDVPRQLQLMIDHIIAAQEFMPMPEEGWERFVRDVGYTNEKHGLDLQMPQQQPTRGRED